MSVRSKVERLERAAPKRTAASEECEACAGLRAGLSRVYGGLVEPFTNCTPDKCAVMHRNIVRVYGGADGDDLKAAA